MRASFRPILEVDALDVFERELFSFRSHYLEFGAFGLGLTRVSAWRTERNRRMVRAGAADEVFVTLFLEGKHSIDADGQLRSCHAGDILVTLSQRPIKVWSRLYTTITLRLPRQSLAAICPGLDDAHGLVLRGGTPLNAIMTGHLTGLRQCSARLSAPEAAAVARASVALAGTCIVCASPSPPLSAGTG